jgi:ribosome-associated toxin RatA of RatAB toxin-antitoxin module
MAEIAGRVLIDCPIEVVYEAFEDVSRWPWILPDTLAVTVHYFDGYNQEFSMTVAQPEGLETVRGVRYCRPPHALELVQTTPPPGFSRLSGHWRFRTVGGATEVLATRSFELASADASETARAAERLRRVLTANLERFRVAIEPCEPR